MTYAIYHGDQTPFYLTTKDVADIVNLAIKLQRPILVEGEAGCGKTLLAWSIAHELELPDPVVIPVKSTSQAKDLLYRFDALRRLQDAQRHDEEASTRVRYVYPYIDLQPLGLAIHQGGPSVILIDEVDKADIDFPNDLLDVLGDFRFDIEDLPAEESGLCQEIKGFGRPVRIAPERPRPIVVITSNREKQLPEPFLRRCLYIELKLPRDAETLEQIVRKNLEIDPLALSEELIRSAVATFLGVRERAEEQPMQKLPATSELVDWVKVLHWQGHSPGEIEAAGQRPPYWRILFKTMQDLAAYESATEDR